VGPRRLLPLRLLRTFGLRAGRPQFASSLKPEGGGAWLHLRQTGAGRQDAMSDAAALRRSSTCARAIVGLFKALPMVACSG
jgi:hypothetical protein